MKNLEEFLYKGTYVQIYWQEDTKLLQTIWTTPLQFVEDKYKKDYLKYIELTKIYKPHYLLIDTQVSKMTLNQGDYAFFEETKWEDSEQSLKKMAWVISKDIFSQISYEIAVDEFAEKYFQVQYFDDSEEAMKWLLSLHE